MRITKKDLKKFGLTAERAGCRAANRGSTPVGHTEERRKRIMGELEKAGDERIERATERFFVHLEEEDNRRKKAKTEEMTGRSNQAAASSSGGGGAEVQRSRGGVPLEITNKRRADEDQQEQPEKKGKNEKEERETKRSTDEWETYAKDLKARAERRAEDNKRAKVGEDLDNDAMMEVIGAI